MTMIIPRPFQDSAGPTKSGFSISLGALKSEAQFFKVSITKVAQVELFKRELKQGDCLKLMLSDEPGKVHLLGIALQADMAQENAFPVTISGAYKTASVRLTPWCRVAPGPRPAMEMALAVKSGDVAMVKLPDWARVPAQKVGHGKPVLGD